MAGTWLIDISSHQGPGFSVGSAVAEGYAGVIMKATEGVGWYDDMFDSYAGQVLAAGAVPGAYHFLRAGDGRAQCDAFWSRIRDHGGPEGWIAACDNEADAGWGTTVTFFQRWRELAGDHPLVMYSGNWWWEPRGWNGASLTPYLWDSRYVSGIDYGSRLYERVPDSWWTSRYGGWDAVTLLQFSSAGVVAGQHVDVNSFRGSVEELKALLTRGGGSGPALPPGEGSGGSEGDWNLGMSFDDFKNGTVGAAPPDWMGGPRDRMRMGDWYGALPAKLTEIDAAAREARDLARQALAKLEALSLSGVDVAALAAALAPLLPVAPTAAEVADAVADEAAGRLAE